MPQRTCTTRACHTSGISTKSRGGSSARVARSHGSHVGARGRHPCGPQPPHERCTAAPLKLTVCLQPCRDGLCLARHNKPALGADVDLRQQHAGNRHAARVSQPRLRRYCEVVQVSTATAAPFGVEPGCHGCCARQLRPSRGCLLLTHLPPRERDDRSALYRGEPLDVQDKAVLPCLLPIQPRPRQAPRTTKSASPPRATGAGRRERGAVRTGSLLVQLHTVQCTGQGCQQRGAVP